MQYIFWIQLYKLNNLRDWPFIFMLIIFIENISIKYSLIWRKKVMQSNFCLMQK